MGEPKAEIMVRPLFWRSAIPTKFGLRKGLGSGTQGEDSVVYGCTDTVIVVE